VGLRTVQIFQVDPGNTVGYQNVSILDFTGAKNDGGGGEK